MISRILLGAQERTQSPQSAQALQLGAEVKIGHYIFRISDLLGRGNQGTVWAAIRTDGGVPVAIKETICNSEADLVAAEREPVLMQSIVGLAKRDLNIVVSPDVVASETVSTKSGAKAVRFAMTQMLGESLSTFLQNFANATSSANASSASHRFGEAHEFTFALVSKLVAAFHSISPVALHRDISAENLLVSVDKGIANPEFALIDFGLAVHSEIWPTMMHKVPAVGNCHYWPPSAWYIFMYGGSKLLEQDGLRKQYVTQLDLHGVGLLGVQVLLSLLPRVVYTYLPEEMLALRCAWDQYREDTDCYCAQMHQAASGQTSWSTVRQLCISKGIHRVVDSALIRLHDAVEKVSRVCEMLSPSSPLSNTGRLFKALAELISHGFTEGRGSTTSWSIVQAIVGRNRSENVASRLATMPAFIAPASTSYTRKTQPVKRLGHPTYSSAGMGYTNAASNAKAPMAKRQQEKLVTSTSVMAPLPKTVASKLERKAEQEISTDNNISSTEKVSGTVPVLQVVTPVRQETPVTPRGRLGVCTQIDKVEKVMMCIQEQIVEKPAPAVQVRSKDVLVPSIGQAEKVSATNFQASKNGSIMPNTPRNGRGSGTNTPRNGRYFP